MISQSSEQAIEQFLLTQGITPLTNEEIEERLAKITGSQKRAKELMEQYAAGFPVNEDPQYYDAFQCATNKYRAREFFLKDVSAFLSSYMETADAEPVVLHGACATGIDLAFLAQQQPNATFRGYDVQSGMIELANRRKDNLGLSNLEFYKGDHREPQEREIESADIVFTRFGLCLENATTDEMVERTFEEMTKAKIASKRIGKICQRLKNGGHYILNDYRPMDLDELDVFLRAQGLILETTFRTLDVPEADMNVYNRAYQKE